MSCYKILRGSRLPLKYWFTHQKDFFFLFLYSQRCVRVRVCLCPVSSNQYVCDEYEYGQPAGRFGRRPPPAGLRPLLKCVCVCFVSEAEHVRLHLSAPWQPEDETTGKIYNLMHRLTQIFLQSNPLVLTEFRCAKILCGVPCIEFRCLEQVLLVLLSACKC